MNGSIEHVLGIPPQYPQNNIYNVPTMDEYNSGNVPMRDMVRAITALKSVAETLIKQVELQDAVISALLGDKSTRERFVQYLADRKGYGGMDNFEVMRIMNILNQVRPIEKENVENND